LLQHCKGIAASYFKTRLSLRSLLPPLEQLVGVDLAVVGVIVLVAVVVVAAVVGVLLLLSSDQVVDGVLQHVVAGHEVAAVAGLGRYLVSRAVSGGWRGGRVAGSVMLLGAL